MNTSSWVGADRRHLPSLERIICAFDVKRPNIGALGIASLLAERFAASLETFYVGSGSPADAILERAHQARSDLVVLGSHRRSDLGWQFRDDVVRDVSALAECATLTVHEHDVTPAMGHILVPVDFGPATTPALELASALALRFEAKIELLHVGSHASIAGRGVEPLPIAGRALGHAGAQLAALEERVTRLGIAASSRLVVSSGVANGIETYNEQGKFGLVVMGVCGVPQRPLRSTRGVIASLRSRLSVPLLSVRAPQFDFDRPWAGAASSGRTSVGGRAELSA